MSEAPVEPASGTPPRPGRRRRVARVTGWVVLGIVGITALLVTAVLVSFSASSALRVLVAKRALDRAIAKLPGEVQVEIGWPDLHTWELRALVWTSAGDTVLTLDHLYLSADLGAAFGRKLRVRELRIERADVHVPELGALLAAMAADDSSQVDAVDAVQTARVAAAPEVPWFDAGRLIGLPDMQLRALALRDIRLRTPDQVYVVDALDASLDLDPRSTANWIDAELHAHAPGLAAVAVRMESSLGDSVEVRFAPLWVSSEGIAEAPHALEGSVVLPRAFVERRSLAALDGVRWGGLLLGGELGELRSEGNWQSGAWNADLVFLAPERTQLLQRLLVHVELDSLPVVVRALATWPTDDRYGLRARAEGEGVGSVRASVDLDVRPWMDRAELTGRWDGTTAHLDTFAFARAGLEVSGVGWVDRNGIDAQLRFDLDSPALAAAGIEVLPAGTELRARGRADTRGAWPLPDIDIEFDGDARGGFGEVPSLRVRGRHRREGTLVDVRLPEGAVLDGRHVEIAAVHFDGTLDGEAVRAEGRLGLGVAVQEAVLASSVWVRADRTTGLVATFDTLRIDVQQMRWESPAPFTVSADPDGGVRLDDFRLRGDAGDLRVHLDAGADSVDIGASFDLALGRVLLETLLPDSLHAHIPADTTHVRLEAALRGPRSSPSARVELSGALVGDEQWSGMRFATDLWLRAEGPLDVAGAPEDLPERGAAARLQVWHGDTPWLSAEGTSEGRLDLERRRFLRAELDSARIDVRATALDLETIAQWIDPSLPVRGVLGGRITGRIGARDLTADVDVGIRNFGLQQTDGQWWESEVALRLDGRGDLDGRVEVDSLGLHTRFGKIEGTGALDGDRVRLDIAGDLLLPHSVFETLLATALDYDLPADTLAVRFDLLAEGPTASPSGYAEFGIGLRGAEDLPPLALAARAWLRGTGADPWPGTPPDDLPARGVLTELRLAHADSVWVQMRAVLPAEVGIRPGRWAPIEGDPAHAKLDTRTLDVAQISALLGLGRSGRFGGDLRVAMEVRTDEDRVALKGAVDSRRLRVDLPDGSWAQARAAIRIGGDSTQPRVDGGITIEGGVLRLPDVPPPLHDAQGDALLWEKPQVAPVAGPANGEPVTATIAADPITKAVVPDLDLTLSIPGNLRLRGAGLDVELSGALTARTSAGTVAVLGELRATRGTYDFLGRRFEVQSGRVEFFGDLDPQLDLRLATSMGADTYFVDLRGTAMQPRFELSSDPARSEGDIVSALLFGRRIDELDEGQTALLRQRTQEVATQLGANLLAQRIGREIGVDVLSIQSTGEEGARALVVGKYLGPDVLVQYEQVLEEGQAALVRIEYALSRFFKVETTATQGDHSGIELKWSRDY